MAVKRRYRDDDIRNYLNEMVEKKLNRIIQDLCYIGETVLRVAREGHRYTDRTGNLTSSIGYCVLDDGRPIVQSTFDAISSTANQGTSKGQSYMQELIRENRKGIVLIVVAGMEYAVYVNAKGLDVLDSAEIKAEEMIEELKVRFHLK